MPLCAQVSNYCFCIISEASISLLTSTNFMNINILYMVLCVCACVCMMCVCACVFLVRMRIARILISVSCNCGVWLSLFVVCQLVCHPKCEPEVSDTVSLSLCARHAVAMPTTGHSGMYGPRKYKTSQPSPSDRPHSSNIYSTQYKYIYGIYV